MSNAKETWDEVRAKLESLGLKLKYHLAEERGGGDDADGHDADIDDSADDSGGEFSDDAAPANDAGVLTADEVSSDGAARPFGSMADKGQKELRSLLDGVDKFVDMIDDAFDSLGKASRDEAVRSDMRDIGESFRNALAASWHDAGADLREILTRPKQPRNPDEPLIGEIIDPDSGTDPMSDTGGES